MFGFVKDGKRYPSVTFRPSTDVQAILVRVDGLRGLNRSALINAALEVGLPAVVDRIGKAIRATGSQRN